MAGWDYSLGSPYGDNTIWGSIARGLGGVGEAFSQVQRVKQAQDQQAFSDLQTKLKLFPNADDATKQSWIGAYQQQVGKNKFWDRSAFQWPTQTQTTGQPNVMGPAAPSTPIPRPSPFTEVPPPAPNATSATSPPAPSGIDPFAATRKPEEAVPPVPPGTQVAPYTPGVPKTEYMLPGVSGANRPLGETYPPGTPTGDALRRVVPANLLTVPRDQLPPEVQSQVDEVTKRVTGAALRAPVNLGDFVSGYRLRGGAETEPQARAFIKSLEDRVNDGSMTVSEAIAQVQKSPYFISQSADQARFTARQAAVHTRIQKIVDAALTAAKDGNLEEAKQLRGQAAQQLQIANGALASDAQNADQTFGGLSVQIPDDTMLTNAGAAHARTAARQDISQGTQVGEILDKVRRGIPLTPGEQRVLNTVHPPRRPAAVVNLPASKPDWITGGDGKPYQVRYVTNPRTGQETPQFNYNGHWVGEAQFRGLTGAKPGTVPKQLRGEDLAAAYKATYTRFVNSTGGPNPRRDAQGNLTGKGYEQQIAEFIKTVTGPEIGWPMAKAVAQVKARFPQWGVTGTPGATSAVPGAGTASRAGGMPSDLKPVGTNKTTGHRIGQDAGGKYWDLDTKQQVDAATGQPVR